MDKFHLVSKFQPAGDQPQAIRKLIAGVKRGDRYQTLLGVTGSGKTFTMANVIAAINKPTLVIAPNKTLAAQLYQEYKAFFPKNRVCYFVSYYDYYQPEAYLPVTDTYIEKEAMINEEIDRYRHVATSSLLTRRDVIVVASVSCIYNLGVPERYFEATISLEVGKPITRPDLIRSLVKIGFSRNNVGQKRGTFRVRGDQFEIYAASEETIYQVELADQKIKCLAIADKTTRHVKENLNDLIIFPPKHFVTTLPERERAIKDIRAELKERLQYLTKKGLLLEAERLERRTRYDLEMMATLGYCHGIENYSRPLSGKLPGDPPETLLSYFPRKRREIREERELTRTGTPVAEQSSLRGTARTNAEGFILPLLKGVPRSGEGFSSPDFLTIIDESHIAVPQIAGMYEGDQSRKRILVEFGWRLPSALDNRPLNFKEFQARIGETIFTSATPAEFERKHSVQVAEQIVRPTGLVDPPIEIRPVFSSHRHSDPPAGGEESTPSVIPAKAGIHKSSSVIARVPPKQSSRSENLRLSRSARNDKQNDWSQIDDVMAEAMATAKKGERTLIITLTKKMAEELAEFLTEKGFRAKFMHSDTKTLERTEILKGLRSKDFDVLIGVNLLREGLDLPEVSLVAILDADREGFLRSEVSLIQTMGRAARNLGGRVILYADSITGSMKRAIAECDRRRKIQLEYNRKHGITPQSIQKEIREMNA